MYENNRYVMMTAARTRIPSATRIGTISLLGWFSGIKLFQTDDAHTGVIETMVAIQLFIGRIIMKIIDLYISR